MITKIIKKILLFKRYNGNKKMFEGYFNRIINANKIEDANNEDSSKKEWLKKWSIFPFNPTVLGWKAFSGYMNNDINLVPNDVARNFIEPILTPEEYQPFYNDKNSLSMFMNNEWLPKTYFRSMDGKLYDGNYIVVKRENFHKLFNGVDKLVVKPAKDMGGKGVTLFQRKGADFIDSENNLLSLSFLEETYKTNFLIQECLKQSEFMAQFNPSSVNTLRIATYRDVKTGEIDILGAVIRIGGKGSFVDNACSGGSFVYVDENGRLGKFACNEHGVRRAVYNDIDFSKEEYIIPNFEQIKQFVYNVARRMPHMSLFANDVAIDENGMPRLIEVNTVQFSYWFYQFNGKAVFGKYTDDLLEYCLAENKKLKLIQSLKYN